MLVYGDKSFEADLDEILEYLWDSVQDHCLNRRDPTRATLIQAGQLEQALADAHENSNAISFGVVEAAQEFTNSIVPLLFSPPEEENRQDLLKNLEEKWSALNKAVEDDVPEPFTLQVKIPEGFEYYALYPEQYAAAAKLWLEQHASSGNVLVVGLRSIGTTLSAVVQETLKVSGCNASRITLRPHGNPFDRKANIPGECLTDKQHVIIVDEGPGASGSSMAAVAHAVVEPGFNLDQITFFPGHAGLPGSAASPEILDCWNKVRRIAIPLEQVTWLKESGEHGSLSELLLEKTKGKNIPALFNRTEALAPGDWRKYAFAQERDWPAAATTFERLKFLCHSTSNAKAVWKFSGLGSFLDSTLLTAEELPDTSEILASEQIPPLSSYMGFTLSIWEPGPRLKASDAADLRTVEMLGIYLLKSAGPDLDEEASKKAFETLRHMAYWNLKKATGNDELAEKLNTLALKCFPSVRESYTDGRMAPYEWHRHRDTIRKSDWFGHTHDHTVIGNQSLVWDIAGTIVEWNLDYRAEKKLLYTLMDHGIRPGKEELLFYKIIYAIFRYALFEYSPGNNDQERERVNKARDYYQRIYFALLNN